MSDPGAGWRPKHLRDLLAEARFEVIPLRGVEEQVAHLPAGSTLTITCSPRKGVDATIDLGERLSAAGFRVVPHLAARQVRGGGHLAEVVDRLTAARVPEVFVIGGDALEPSGPYGSALSLLEAIGRLATRFPDGRLPAIGVGAYPERHPFISDQDLIEGLRAKQAFATHMDTQICFDPTAIARWLVRIRGLGIELPVAVGLPGALKRRRLLEISLRVGVGDSVRYITKHGGIVARLMRRRGYRPDGFLAGLAPLVGDPRLAIAGLHINTFNQVEDTERWRRHALATYGGRDDERERARGSAS